MGSAAARAMGLLVTLLSGLLLVRSQEAAPVIAADNIMHLRSAVRLDFVDLPQEFGQIASGWVAASPDGSRFAFLNRSGGVVLWDERSGRIKTSVAVCADDGKPGAFVDGAITITGTGAVFAAAYAAGASGYVGYHPFGDEVDVETLCDLPDTPMRVWIAENGWNWFERMTAFGEVYVAGFPLKWGCRQRQVETCAFDEQTRPSGPEADGDAFLRIGRVEPPLAITASATALVKRWNLEMGAVTAQAQAAALPGIGQANRDGRFFVYTDNGSTALRLLDFETGENRVVTELNGTYIPFLLLTNAGDVIISINAGLEPVVIAWDVATGKRYDLGLYRRCNRQPDMVRLSSDGTTVVVGCDTGLDVWRIGDEVTE